ncbi:MAG: C39 family peptidase, partial [Planctomycetes bacterium]|nr:C39 family peptidase [Planctomycetota bacterium]
MSTVSPSIPTLREFRAALESHDLRRQRALLEARPEEERLGWLRSPEALDAWLEHAHQARDPRRGRALAWRLRAVEGSTARSIFHEIRRHRWFGRDSHALDLLGRHATLVEDSPELWSEEILTYGGVRRVRTARRLFDRRRDRLAPRDRVLLEARVLAWEDRRVDAGVLLAEHHDLLEDSPIYLARRIHLALENGTFEEASALADAALNRFPDSLATLYPAARVAEVRDDRPRAVALLDRIVELSPDGIYATWTRGRREFLVRLEDPAVLLSVPTLQQHRAHCGPNSLSLLARFWGEAHDQESIAAEVWDEGTSLAKMWRWAERHGFETHVFRGDPARVRRLLDLGVPTIVERSWEHGGHYFIFIGYSRDGSELYLRDPDAPELVRYPIDEFDEIFHVHDAWCCTFWPADRRPAGIEAIDWPGESALRAVDLAMDRLGAADPRELARAVDAVDESEAPSCVGLARLSIADSIGDRDAVREAGRAIIERHPRSTIIRSRVVGHSFHRLPPEEVRELSDQVVEETLHPQCWSLHVSVCCRVGDHLTAREWARRLRILMPSAEESALANANYLLDIGSDERAIAWLEVAEEISSGGPFFLARLASSLIHVGHLDRVDTLLAAALERRPNYDFARFLGARRWEVAGEIGRAIEAYRENLDACP